MQSSKTDLTLPFWLTNSYRSTLLKDSLQHFMCAISNNNLTESRNEIMQCLRLVKTYLLRRVQCRHLVKHETIWEILRGKQVQVIVEVGSFDGLDAVEFSRMFPDAEVYAFEADPRNYELLKKNTSIRKKITSIQKAVFNFTGQGAFHASDGKGTIDHVRSSGSMLVPKPIFKETFPNIAFDKDFLVETITVFDWAKQNNIKQIDLLWIDAQGAELQILEGMKDLLYKTKVIFLEVWQDCYYEDGANLDNIESFLREFGYKKTHIWLDSSIGDALFQREN